MSVSTRETEKNRTAATAEFFSTLLAELDIGIISDKFIFSFKKILIFHLFQMCYFSNKSFVYKCLLV